MMCDYLNSFMAQRKLPDVPASEYMECGLKRFCRKMLAKTFMIIFCVHYLEHPLIEMRRSHENEQ